MDAYRTRRAARTGFTLVEMLAVVVIIGILASLITAAAMAAIRAAKRARIILEVQNLDQQLKAYREKFGEYPPDFTDLAAVARHLSVAFPNFRPRSGGNSLTMLEFVQQNFSDQSKFNPSTALVFWLGGQRDVDAFPSRQDNTGAFVGFSANPRNPFDGSASRIGPFYDFDRTRLDVKNGNPYQYYPPGVPVGSMASGYGPYVYFRARVNGYTGHPGWAEVGLKPAYDTRIEGPSGAYAWANPKTFQIRAPGLDGRYGTGQHYPLGDDYDEAQYDDLSNFSEGDFGSAMP
jgi:prepilin-type N-terminal cleavage/methylation domain-containing protein